jgi:hypothetical protein
VRNSIEQPNIREHDDFKQAAGDNAIFAGHSVNRLGASIVLVPAAAVRKV